MSFGRFTYTLILPDMMKSLGFTTTKMGVLGMGIVFGYTVHSFLSGKLAHIIGAELTVKLSVFLISVSLFILGYFSNFSILLVSMIVLGAGTAGSYIPLISILNQHFDEKGRIFGIVMGGAGTGIVLCGYFIPMLLLLSETHGYRISWYALAIINFLVFLLSLLFLRPNKFLEGDESKEDKENTIFQIFKTNAPLKITVVIYFLTGFSYIIYTTYFGTYSVDEIGFSIRSTGIMWSLFGFNTIVSGFIWGALSDKINKLNVAILLCGLVALSILIIIPFRLETIFYASTFLFGFSYMGYITVNASIISDEVNKIEMAKIYGVATLVHGSGQVISTSLAGFLKDITNTFKVPLSLSFLMFVACVFLFLFLKKRAGR
jgi:MFS family permease